MKRCNANFMVDVARGKQTWRPTREFAQKQEGKGGKFISSGQFGKRKLCGGHANTVSSETRRA